MSRSRRVHASHSVRRNLTAVFGSLQPLNLLYVLPLLMSLGWFGDMLLEILTEWKLGPASAGPLHIPELPAGKIAGLLAFPVLASVGFFWLRRQLETLEPYIEDNAGAGPRRVLILFLSRPGADVDPARPPGDSSQPPRGHEGWLTGSDAVVGLRLDRSDDLKHFKGSWRMPLEAIASHLSRLEHVVIVPSAKRPGSVRGGTWERADLFVDCVKAMWPPERDPPEFDVRARDCGIDFEGADALLQELNAVYRTLTGEHGYKNTDIVIDVTGGQRPCTFAGATVASRKDRIVQYVTAQFGKDGDADNMIYSVRTYDIHYEAPDDNAESNA